MAGERRSAGEGSTGARRTVPFLLAIPLLVAGCAASPHLLDSDPANGYALYRSGRLDERELEALCRQGVEEILVLSGTAADRECRMRARLCPELRVRYDRRQRARVPLSEPFLRAFDAWVEEGRREGRKLAFRCRHGWHRTGRLAAYYQMRFLGAGVEEAVAEMVRRGRFMWRHPYLEPQVAALEDHARARSCRTEPRHCPETGRGTSEGLGPEGFFADVCREPSAGSRGG